jgi:hypothetical protein
MTTGSRLAAGIVALEREAVRHGGKLCTDSDCDMEGEPHWHPPAGLFAWPCCGSRVHRDDCALKDMTEMRRTPTETVVVSKL